VRLLPHNGWRLVFLLGVGLVVAIAIVLTVIPTLNLAAGKKYWRPIIDKQSVGIDANTASIKKLNTEVVKLTEQTADINRFLGRPVENDDEQ